MARTSASLWKDIIIVFTGNVINICISQDDLDTRNKWQVTHLNEKKKKKTEDRGLSLEVQNRHTSSHQPWTTEPLYIPLFSPSRSHRPSAFRNSLDIGV